MRGLLGEKQRVERESDKANLRPRDAQSQLKRPPNVQLLSTIVRESYANLKTLVTNARQAARFG